MVFLFFTNLVDLKTIDSLKLKDYYCIIFLFINAKHITFKYYIGLIT